MIPTESEEHDIHSTALVHHCTLFRSKIRQTRPPEELGGRIGNTRHLEVVAHMGVKPLRHRRGISADNFQGHMLLYIGTIGQ
jgi:hypothetical protein